MRPSLQNLFANGILTSLRWNNLYPIKEMRFVKGSGGASPGGVSNPEAFGDDPAANLSPRFVHGLRLTEHFAIGNLNASFASAYTRRLLDNEAPRNTGRASSDGDEFEGKTCAAADGTVNRDQWTHALAGACSAPLW